MCGQLDDPTLAVDHNYTTLGSDLCVPFSRPSQPRPAYSVLFHALIFAISACRLAKSQNFAIQSLGPFLNGALSAFTNSIFVSWACRLDTSRYRISVLSKISPSELFQIVSFGTCLILVAGDQLIQETQAATQGS